MNEKKLMTKIQYTHTYVGHRKTSNERRVSGKRQTLILAIRTELSETQEYQPYTITS